MDQCERARIQACGPTAPRGLALGGTYCPRGSFNRSLSLSLFLSLSLSLSLFLFLRSARPIKRPLQKIDAAVAHRTLARFGADYRLSSRSRECRRFRSSLELT